MAQSREVSMAHFMSVSLPCIVYTAPVGSLWHSLEKVLWHISCRYPYLVLFILLLQDLCGTV